MAKVHSPEAFRWLVNEQPSLKALIDRFPDDWVESDARLKALLAEGGAAAVVQAAQGSQSHVERIVKSGVNPAVVESSLPVLLRSRMMVLALKNYSLAAQTKTTGRVAFDERNAALLQGVLFEGSGLKRKPVDPAAFAAAWAQVDQKSFLMPLVNKKGIYCFYTIDLVRSLAEFIGQRRCVELGAGDGTLSRFLNDAGCAVTPTDNHSWSQFIDYPAEVLKFDAGAALRHFRPAVVLASWPDPENAWEQKVFASPRVETYIVLGSSVPGVTGNRRAYEASGWVREDRPDWAQGLLPVEQGPEALVFRRP